MVKIVVFFLVCCVGFAYTQEPEVTALIPEQKESWDIGIAEFSTGSITQENIFLRRSLPLAILESLSSVTAHTLDDSEILSMQSSLLSQAELTAMESLWNLRQERAQAFVEGMELGPLDEKIQSGEIMLEKLKFYDSSEISIEKSYPVEFRKKGDEDLLPVLKGPIADVAERENIDLLIAGIISEIEGALHVEVQIFAAGEHKTTVTRVSGTSESIVGQLDQINDLLRTIALGRDWADIVVDAQNPDAQVYIDGSLVGVGISHTQNLEPDLHEIVVRAAGYQEYRADIVLESGIRTEVIAPLVPLGTVSVLIDSLPLGSTVYLGADYIGDTPFFFGHNGTPGRLTFRREGFHQSSYILDDDRLVSVNLIPEDIDMDFLIESSRNRFYSSFGAFVISLPIPFLAWYGSIEQIIAMENSSGQERQQHFVLQNVLYYTYVGGVFITGGLLVDSVVQLFRYFEIQESLGR